MELVIENKKLSSKILYFYLELKFFIKLALIENK